MPTGRRITARCRRHWQPSSRRHFPRFRWNHMWSRRRRTWWGITALPDRQYYLLPARSRASTALDPLAADRDDHAQDQHSAEEQPDVAQQMEQTRAGEEGRPAMRADKHHGHDAQRRTKEGQDRASHQRADKLSV